MVLLAKLAVLLKSVDAMSNILGTFDPLSTSQADIPLGAFDVFVEKPALLSLICYELTWSLGYSVIQS